jgi:hypothetical protein
MSVFEVTIDPEHYRAIQEQLNLLTTGHGLLEILHQSSLSNATILHTRALHRDEEEEGNSLAQSGQDGGSEGGEGRGAEDSRKVSGGAKDKASRKKGKSNRLPPGLEEEGEDAGRPLVEDEEVEVYGLARSKGKVSFFADPFCCCSCSPLSSSRHLLSSLAEQEEEQAASPSRGKRGRRGASSSSSSAFCPILRLRHE